MEGRPATVASQAATVLAKRARPLQQGQGEMVNTVLQSAISMAKELRIVWIGHTPYVKEDGRWVLPFPTVATMDKGLPRGQALARVQSQGRYCQERWEGRRDL